MLEANTQLPEDKSGYYCLSPEAQIVPLDTSFKLPVYQVILRGRRFQINDFTHRMLEVFRTPHTITAACNTLGISTSDMDHTIDRLLVRNRILIPYGQLSEEDRTQPIETRRLPLVRASLLSQQLASLFTRRMDVLFTPGYVAIAVTLILASYAILIHKLGRGSLVLASSLSAADWLAGVILVYASLFVHELGHSAACSRYGAKHGDIGIGIYLIWPVFYADVSDGWRLPRRQRVVIDLGGVYFQSMAAALYVLIWLFSGWPPLAFSVYCIMASIILNLNPFLRFDGYWLFTDAIGVPRPWSTGLELIYHRSRRYFIGPQIHKNAMLDALPRATVYTLVVYAILATLFTGVCILGIALFFIPRMIEFYPQALSQFVALVSSGQIGFGIVKLIFKFFIVSLSAFGLVVFAYRLSIKGLQYTKGIVSAKDQSSRQATPSPPSDSRRSKYDSAFAK